MTVASLSIEFMLAVASVALVMIGTMAALLSGNVIKRVGGLLIGGFGAVASLAALGAGSEPIVAGAALLFVYAVFGAVIAVRLQESYGSIEAPDVDSADADGDAQERAS
ncbi:MAG: hypothetical protein NT015_16980 [Alphaproteobacteria bacterium]|nr:hypothetical protein [Alphaproteobacteria bacterium]